MYRTKEVAVRGKPFPNVQVSFGGEVIHTAEGPTARIDARAFITKHSAENEGNVERFVASFLKSQKVAA